MREWWQSLAERERRTLIAGAVALLAILYYAAIWQPAHQRVETLEQRVEQSRELLSWMQQAAAEVKALRGQAGSQPTGGSDQALYALADASAREAGLGNAIREVSPTGENRVRVDLEGASFDQLVAWLARLRTEHAITAGPVSVRETDAQGRVNAQVVLQGPQA